MNHMRLWAAAAIIALIVIVGFWLSVPHTRDVHEVRDNLAVEESIPEVTLRDVYKKGVHTVTGSIMAPNACSTISSSAMLQDDASGAQNILVTVALENGVGVCLELPTRETFQVTVAAPAHLPFTATVNGVLATTTAL